MENKTIDEELERLYIRQAALLESIEQATDTDRKKMLKGQLHIVRVLIQKLRERKYKK